MNRCGKPYRDQAEALMSKKGRTGAYLAVPCRCLKWHLRRQVAVTVIATRRIKAAQRRAAKETGFPPEVKRAIRERAGHRCESCGVPVPPGFGIVQHRLARKMGGRRTPLHNSAANGALQCGTPLTGCNGLAEARDPHMHEAGFWLEEHESPLEVPILWHGEFGGVRKWLTPDGGYSDYSPAARGEAA